MPRSFQTIYGFVFSRYQAQFGAEPYVFFARSAQRLVVGDQAGRPVLAYPETNITLLFDLSPVLGPTAAIQRATVNLAEAGSLDLSVLSRLGAPVIVPGGGKRAQGVAMPLNLLIGGTTYVATLSVGYSDGSIGGVFVAGFETALSVPPQFIPPPPPPEPFILDHSLLDGSDVLV